MMNELGWKPLNERRKEQRLVLLFKIAIPAENNIKYNQRPSRTSNSKQIKVLSATTEVYKHSFFLRTVKDWNTLTESAVSSKTVEGFKAAITLLDNFCSLTELTSSIIQIERLLKVLTVTTIRTLV